MTQTEALGAYVGVLLLHGLLAKSRMPLESHPVRGSVERGDDDFKSW